MEFEELKIEIPIEEEQEEEQEGLQLPPKKYENTAGGFVTGFDVNSKEAIERKARRRKRFGVIEEKEEEETNKDKETDGNDENEMILPKDTPKIPEGEIRKDALHVYGIDNMSTKDVFNYFEEYGPESIEWIDDASCNVVWEDEHSAARALDSMGKSLNSSEPGNENSVLQWKAGPLCKKAKGRLLLRFATKKDKKQPGAAKRSMYYLVHGYPGQSTGKKKGIVSKSRKRKLMQDKERARHKYSGEPDVEFIEKMEVEEQEKMEVDEPAMKVIVKNDRTLESTSKEVPERLRMRMHADDLGSENDPDEKSKIHDRLQERLQERKPDKLQDKIQDRIQIEVDNTAKNEGIDLRERLKTRRKHGFDFMDRPSLSIEIREEQS
ncbi:nuclear cap-binding protein subunit 3-like [Actinia tenebrosa]|uniref:Nuclear cap-binding protein subunit 3 n=1 Tax=Actinia tenebrosa TaxID=6105 RepID=A0A6P8IC89_ACTTE|nr:nuclear cap-binding protein subunit 3-like [Actinia tenebrosa]